MGQWIDFKAIFSFFVLDLFEEFVGEIIAFKIAPNDLNSKASQFVRS